MAVGKMCSVDVVLSGHLLGSFLPDQGTQARDGLTVSTHGCQIIITISMRIKKNVTLLLESMKQKIYMCLS